MALMDYSGARGTLIQEKNQKLVMSQSGRMGILRRSHKAGYELRMAICTYKVAHVYGYELSLNGWTQ
jgi:hypothetical protein